MNRAQAQAPEFARGAVPVDDKWLGIPHPLAAIEGATNAIRYKTEILEDVTMVGPGARLFEPG
ncbi:MAG: hypothetical protein GTO14_08880 [Anaerolineales bacterium]|nr:hypothetical protein [Anaerolineales bacterium]